MSDASPPPGVPVVYLRVYEPLDAFAPAERAFWSRYVADPPSGAEIDEWERRESWRRVVSGPQGSVPSAEVGRARVLRLADAVLVCPVQVRLRCAAAAREAARTLPPPVVAAGLVPAGGPAGPGPALGEEAEAEGGGRSVDRRLRTLTAAWEVPWAWFTIVRPDDRVADGGYQVPMARARSRVARALRTVREALGDSVPTEEVEQVARWLEEFHPRAWVELDPRAVRRLVPDDGDLGAEDVRLGLDCLAEGDATGVAAAYQRLTRRTQRLKAWSSAS